MSWIKSDDDGWWENNRTSKMSTTSVWKFLGSNKMLFVVIALRFFSNYGVCRVLLLPIMLFCICWALKVKRWTWERTKLLVILNLSMFFSFHSSLESNLVQKELRHGGDAAADRQWHQLISNDFQNHSRDMFMEAHTIHFAECRIKQGENCSPCAAIFPRILRTLDNFAFTLSNYDGKHPK